MVGADTLEMRKLENSRTSLSAQGEVEGNIRRQTYVVFVIAGEHFFKHIIVYYCNLYTHFNCMRKKLKGNMRILDTLCAIADIT